jgi:hypothetical protein
MSRIRVGVPQCTTGVAALALCVCFGGAIRDDQGFAEHLRKADTADTLYAKIDHLREAVALRPGHPDNIAIEFHVALLLSQCPDREHHQGPRPEEALCALEGIVAKYDHMHYYQADTPDEEMPSLRSYAGVSPQVVVPRACILAAEMHYVLRHDAEKAREYLLKGMACIRMTYERRRQDWANKRPPREAGLDDPFGGEIARAKWATRYAAWERRRKRAAEGDVLDESELPVARTLVKLYGETFGKQRPSEVATAMGPIVRSFPGTPMAAIAQEHMDRAGEIMIRGSQEAKQKEAWGEKRP